METLLIGLYLPCIAMFDWLLGSDEISLSDWVDRHSNSRNAAGVLLFLKHKKHSDVCRIKGVIVDHNGNEMDNHEWRDIPYDHSIKDFFKGGGKAKVIFYSFDWFRSDDWDFRDAQNGIDVLR